MRDNTQRDERNGAAYVCVCVCVYIYIYMCECVYVCVYMYIHEHFLRELTSAELDCNSRVKPVASE